MLREDVGTNPLEPSVIRYRVATVADLDAILGIHGLCFTPETNALMYFGPGFLRAAYRWLITSEMTFTVVAERGGEVVGYESASDRPYRGPLFRNNASRLVAAIVRRPWILLNKDVSIRFISEALRKRQEEDPDKTVAAQLVLMGVHPDHRQGFEVANQLLVHVMAQGRARGWKRVIAGAHKKNLAILFLYKMHGFRSNPYLETEALSFMEFRFS